MSDIDEAIVVILSVVAVRREVNMIDPNFGGLLHGESIASRRKDLVDLEVTNDDV